MKKHVLIIGVFLFVSGIAFGQNEEEIAKARGLEILSLARNAVYQKGELKKPRNLKIQVFSKILDKTESRNGIHKFVQTSNSFQVDSYSFGRNGEVRITELNDENQITFKLLATNGVRHFEKYGTIRNGEFFDNKILPPFSDGMIEKSIAGYIFDFSPIFLQFPDNISARYLGKAEAPEGRADIIVIRLSNGNETKYLFDEKSHLLRMTITEREISNVTSKTTYYFSDHQLINGMLIPTKRKKQTKIILYSENEDSKVPERISTSISEAKIKVELDQTFDKHEFSDEVDAKALEKQAKNLEKTVNDLLDEG